MFVWLARRLLVKFLKRKLKASLGSATMGVASLIVAIGVWAQAHPDMLNTFVPDKWEGVVLAGLGLVVAIARMRTVDKNGNE